MKLFEADDVKKELLIQLVTNAGLGVVDEEKDNEFYVRGLDIGLWLSYDADEKSIKIFTYAPCKEDAPVDDLPLFSEDCNRKYKLVQFSSTVYEDGSGYLNGSYFIYYNFGLNISQLVHTMRKFSQIFVEAIRELDSDDTFFS